MNADVVLDVLAVHRLTRLVTLDSITETPRRAVVRAAGVPVPDDQLAHEAVADALAENPTGVPKLAELLTCRWCASVWIAGAVVLVHHTATWRRLRLLLALSSASTLVAGIET